MRLLVTCLAAVFLIGLARLAPAVDAIPERSLLAPSQAEKLLASVADLPLDASRRQLLELAWDVASAHPLQPHIKTRAREQEVVFDAMLQLDQAAMAGSGIKQIPNWRRGSAYASMALYLLAHDRAEEIGPLMVLAEELADVADQDWRRDTIMSKIARAKMKLGQVAEAKEIDQGLEPMLQGVVPGVQAEEPLEEKELEGLMARLAEVVAGKHFDQTKTASQTLQTLYKTHFKNPQRRAKIEEALRASYEKLPVIMKVESLLNLAVFCVEQEDQAQGLVYAMEARELVASVGWPVDFYIPLLGRVAGVRARCGDAKGAREDATKAVDVYDKEYKNFETFRHARMIRPVAEAYHYLGDEKKSLALYARVLEAGAVNPNARCRAEDLSATCLSMAMLAVEPTDAMWQRMRQIRAGLGDPW
jgi:tetratricopeptide (TPR) repeat protein